MDHLTRPEGSAPADLHLSRRAALATLTAGYAVAALSAEAKPISTPADGLLVEEARLPAADVPLPAYVARPKGSTPRPAVIVVNEVFGVHDYIKDVCRRLARAGYVAVAPHFFHRSGVDIAKMSDVSKILPIVQQAGDAQVDGDVAAAVAWLKAQPFAKPGAIGITGFCWGGAVVWRSAMVNPDIRAGVAWYGRLSALVPRAAELRAPVLGLYASDDKGIPQADVDAMRAALKAAGRPGEIVVYPGTEHGFHADYRDGYDAAAAADGWKRMLAHFKTNGVA